MSERWTVATKKQAEFFCKFIMEQIEEGKERTYELMRPARTRKQNATLHLLFRNMARDLNDAGAPDIPHPFNPTFRMSWTEDKVKELLFKPYCQHLMKTDKSSDLDTKQLSEVMEALIDGVNQSVGVYTPIPQTERY